MISSSLKFIHINISQIHAGRELNDELPAKTCISKFQFPVNKAGCPACRYFSINIMKKK